MTYIGNLHIWNSSNADLASLHLQNVMLTPSLLNRYLQGIVIEVPYLCVEFNEQTTYVHQEHIEKDINKKLFHSYT